jgi:hypothetical protein
MAIQFLHGPDQVIAEHADADYERRNHLISGLNELKSNIARIEQYHIYLGNDLSSICDKAILSLQDSPGLQDRELPAQSISARSPAPKINPVSQILDKCATYIINGLDKTGDGIIFLFVKIGKAFGNSSQIT